jgi:DNA polymerase-3 subunit delta'
MSNPLPSSLLNALQRDRLSHAVLLSGESIEVVTGAGETLACLLLNVDKLEHPDLFTVRPAKKSRSIAVDQIRDLIGQLSLGGNQDDGKVALIYEADRMNTNASNALLKTLEEPPPRTTLILITSRPAELLPTVRSRCFRYRIGGLDIQPSDGAWQAWCKDYTAWLNLGLEAARGAQDITERVIGLYGLIARFNEIGSRLTDEALAEGKSEIAEEWTTEERDAFKVGIERGVRQKLIEDISRTTHQFGRRMIRREVDRAPALAGKLARTIESLEKLSGLRALYLKEEVVLESFFLQTLRIWAEPE